MRTDGRAAPKLAGPGSGHLSPCARRGAHHDPCPVSTVETLRKCLSLHLLAAMFMHLWTAANKGVTIYKSPWTSNTRSTIARASLPWTLPPLAAHAKA